MRDTSSIKVIRDNDEDRYRVVSMADESDPTAAAELRAKERFAENIRLSGGPEVPLESIRVAHIDPNPEQLREWRRDLGPLPPEAEGAELKLSLPYALHGGRVYIHLDGFASLEPDQIMEFFEQHLFVHFRAQGMDPGTVLPVMVPNRLP